MCKKITNSHELSADLFQETMLILLEMDEAKIVSMYEKKYIYVYIYAIMSNQWFAKRRNFNKNYRHLEKDEKINNRHIQQSDDVIDIFDAANKIWDIIHQEEKSLKKSSDSGFPYDVEVFKIYMKLGDAKKTAKELNIPYNSIAYTIRNFKKRIRDRFYEN
jgi:hypothetical protein